jgi:hypothetical protein
LDPKYNDGTITVLLYAVQIANAMLGLIIALVGIILRTRMDLEVAKFQIKLLSISPFALGALFCTNGVLTYFYMAKAIAESGSPQESDTLSYVILILMTVVGLVSQVGGNLIALRVHKHFQKSLILYVEFLLKFEETPRSKVAKKYIPPLDAL